MQNTKKAYPELVAHEFGTAVASHVSSQQAIQQISSQLTDFRGGSDDLSASNNTMVKVETDFQPDNYAGRNIWFGVREFATAALQQLPTVYVMTHDSIAVGEDGPTHEPVEQLASVRSMPNLNVIRPADGNETNTAWKRALAETDCPTMLILARQNLSVLEGRKELAAEGVNKGAYILSEAKGVHIRVVSMQAQNIFDEQDAAYKESILPANVTKRLAIEAGSSFGWGKYVGLQGKTLTIDTWGASAPGNKIFEEYGFAVDNAVNLYESL
ncbi:transketolase [Streptococcus lutetiensis 033]|uniref:Transketolase n=1 Tax=Streptococcus lutetiensis 033 TaxID=1076934 RepID=A0AB33AL11_9STRE|nr:transketolase [Streptococcus lutetiensis 033]